MALVVSTLFGAISARYVFQDAGVALFGFIMMLATVQALLPFADLGLGAAVMNALAAAGTPEQKMEAQATVLGALRILLRLAFVLLLVDLICYATGCWSRLLAIAEMATIPHADEAITGVLGLVAFSIPLGLGYRVFIGLHKTHAAVLMAAVTQPLTLCFVLALASFHAPPIYYSTAWPAGSMLANACITAAALHKLGVRDTRICSTEPRERIGVTFRETAGPMFVISVATPVAYQGDRIILAAVGTPHELSEYSLVAQVFTPLMGLVIATATPLWPLFVKRSSENGDTHRLWLLSSAAFGALGVSFAGLLMLLAPPYGSIVTKGQMSISILLISSFGCLMILQSLNAPAAMRLNDRSGLRYQAIWIGPALLINLFVSIVFTKFLGASGPVLGSIVGLMCAQVLPNYTKLLGMRERIAR